MRVDTARYMSGDVAVHLRNRCRGVNDPWGRGLDRPPGRGRGSFTPRLQYSSRFGGRQRTPADSRCAPSRQWPQLVATAAVTARKRTFKHLVPTFVTSALLRPDER